MKVKSCFAFFFSLTLSLARNDAEAEGSVQYKPGNAQSGNLQYCPAASASRQTISYAPQGALIKKIAKVKDEANKKAWSGTKKDLEAIVEKAEKMYGFENSKHLGRNATMLVPATKQEMEWAINHGEEWERYGWDGEHQGKEGHNTKYINRRTGSEAVYNDATGMIVTNEKLGTRNLGEPGETFKPSTWIAITPWGGHNKLDMRPHGEKVDPSDKLSRDGDQYKYVGILYKRDPDNPDKFYVIDGQTGLPMTPQQAAEMPTTLSDMWKDMGLVCVKNDAEDVVAPVQNQNSPVASVDTSLLESILNEQIAFVKGLLARGEKASQTEIEAYNARVRKFLGELVRIDKEIMSRDISIEDKKKVAEKVITRLTPLANQLKELNAQVLSLNLVEKLIPMTLDGVSPASNSKAVREF